MDTYIADFETITDKKDCRVWAWAICEVGNENNIRIGNNIDDFMAWCAMPRKNYKVLFHNLKFDSQFVMSWLFSNGFTHTINRSDRKTKTFNTLINDKGQYYQIEVVFERKGKTINKVTFQDSKKLLDMSVDEIAKTFELPYQKLEIDYKEFRPVGHELTREEMAYIRNDVRIVAKAVEFFYKNGLTQMTIGRCAFEEYKQLMAKKKKNFERFFPEPGYDEDVRQSYRGGFTYLNPKFAGKIVREGVSLDYNSVYPSVMRDELLPYGRPYYFEGQYRPDELYPLYVQMFRCAFELKPGKIPTVQIRHGSDYRANEYLDHSDGEVTLCMTSVDFEIFLDHYDVYNIEYIGGWAFKAAQGLFDEYVDKWYAVKVNAKKSGNKGMYEISKRMLNSLYGKFGTLPKVTSKVPGMREDGTLIYKDKHVRFGTAVYIGMATFITSYARQRIINAAQRVTDDYNDGRSDIEFIYADTDSLWLKSKGFKLPDYFDYDNMALGKFKFEGEFSRAKFLRQKCYIADFRKPGEEEFKLKVTVAGMPKKCCDQITFNNFKIGATYKGKLQPVNVPGGVVLESVDFTINKV